MRTKLEDSPEKVNSKNREKARIKLAEFEEKTDKMFIFVVYTAIMGVLVTIISILELTKVI